MKGIKAINLQLATSDIVSLLHELGLFITWVKPTGE
jgi:hypothetical protein